MSCPCSGSSKSKPRGKVEASCSKPLVGAKGKPPAKCSSAAATKGSGARSTRSKASGKAAGKATSNTTSKPRKSTAKATGKTSGNAATSRNHPQARRQCANPRTVAEASATWKQKFAMW